MRYAIGILLLASPVVAGEPVYSWQTRVDDPDRVYLYMDGKQIGGWDYREKYYRSFDGTNWGTPTDKAPVSPPATRVLVVPRQTTMVLPQPSLTPSRVRGPVRRSFVTIMDQALAEMTLGIINEIPGAIVDSLKKGNYQLKYESSVTGPAQPPQVVTPPPSPTPQRRLIFRR